MRSAERPGSLVEAVQLNGKELSFNNINDTNGALELLKEFEEPQWWPASTEIPAEWDPRTYCGCLEEGLPV